MHDDLKTENKKLKVALKLASQYLELSCVSCPFFEDKCTCDAPPSDKRDCSEIIYDWLIENGS